MKFKWDHCEQYHGEINLYRKDVREGDVFDGLVLGWVATIATQRGVRFKAWIAFDRPRGVGTFDTRLQAMRHLRTMVRITLMGGSYGPASTN